jgi:hypothetical protein
MKLIVSIRKTRGLAEEAGFGLIAGTAAGPELESRVGDFFLTAKPLV